MKSRTAYAIDAEYIQSLNPLLIELQDLKRQQPAHYTSSIASSFFLESWKRLAYAQDPDAIAYRMTAKGLLAIVLPGCDRHFFTNAGMDLKSAETILQKAFEENIKPRIAPDLADILNNEIPAISKEYFEQVSESFTETTSKAFEKDYWFVEALSKQPRAGATKPGEMRLLLTPPEMHADHCMITAIYATLLSAGFDTPPGLPFLTGITHHLHNAVLPDCGFAGEIALGDYLQPIIRNSQQAALKHLPADIRITVENAVTNHENLENAAGKASSAADVLDRVLDIKWRVRAASVTEKDVLEDLELVHEGPIKSFQTEILKSAGL